LESGAQTDSCVCNGEGSGATIITDTLTGSGHFGYHTVAVIPAEAQDVRIAEVNATSSVYLGKIYVCAYVFMVIIFLCNSVALESQGVAILNGGLRVHGTSSFNALGSEFQYVRNSAEESVFTSGPLQQELTVKVNII